MDKRYKVWLLNVVSDDSKALSGHPVRNDLNRLNSLYQLMTSKSLNPLWITCDECLEVSTNGNDVYVLPVFSGTVFEHLSSLKCRLCGTLALLMCIGRVERLPKFILPIWSINFHKTVICFTGFDFRTRKEKSVLVKMMGGVVLQAFSDKVTHLVAETQDAKSKKFLAAIESHIPVMSISWVDSVWAAANCYSDNLCTEESFIAKHKLRIFTDCVICCSGIASQDRTSLARLIEINGGVYTGSLKRNISTHLVTDMNSGEKYRIARTWGWEEVKVVRLKWLIKSIQKGYRLLESSFETLAEEPNRPVLSHISTPENLARIGSTIDSIESKRQMEGNPDYIVGLINSSSQENAFAASRDIENIPFGRCESSSKFAERFEVIEDPINKVCLEEIVPGDYMEECFLYLCAIPDTNLSKWKMLTNILGANRRGSLDADLTHVVVGVGNLNHILKEQINEMARDRSLSVVKCAWLIECSKSLSVVCISDYLYFQREDNRQFYIRDFNEDLTFRKDKKMQIEDVPLLAVTQCIENETQNRSAKARGDECSSMKRRMQIAEKLSNLAMLREKRQKIAFIDEVESEVHDSHANILENIPQVTSSHQIIAEYRPLDGTVGWEENIPLRVASQVNDPFSQDLIVSWDEEVRYNPSPKTEVSTEESKFLSRNDLHCNKVAIPDSNKHCFKPALHGTLPPSLDERNDKATVQKRRFCFTSTGDHDRNTLAEMVIKLDGEVCDEFDDTVTHLICEKMTRNEKILCAIAKGIFVIKTDYIFQSFKEYRWLKIDKFEWAISMRINRSSKEAAALAAACQRWRLKISKNPQKRAFSGWNAVFYCSEKRFLQLERIITFGGGRASLRNNVESLNGFTLALVEKSEFWTPQEIDRLIESHVECYVIDYVATFLLLDNKGSNKKYYHKDYAAALKSSVRRFNIAN